jgi:hypothetical protein
MEKYSSKGTYTPLQGYEIELDLNKDDYNYLVECVEEFFKNHKIEVDEKESGVVHQMIKNHSIYKYVYAFETSEKLYKKLMKEINKIKNRKILNKNI